MTVKTEKLAGDRHRLGVEIEVALVNIADLYKELLEIGEALHNAVPVRAGKMNNSPLARSNIEMAMRLQLFKLGLTWATSYPWNPLGIVPFGDRVKEGNTAILSHRKKEEKAA